MGHGRITLHAASFTGGNLRSRRLNQHQGAEELRRLDQVLDHWNHHTEKLKNKWLDFSSGIVEAISEEEMRICREELDQRIITNNLRAESRDA
jgi:hypothetical protein